MIMSLIPLEQEFSAAPDTFQGFGKFNSWSTVSFSILIFIRFPGLIHPGILGCAPSAEVLAEWNKREGELISTKQTEERILAQPPQPINVHAGSASEEIKAKVGREGARTIPGRPEHGEHAVPIQPSPRVIHDASRLTMLGFLASPLTVSRW